MHVTKLQHVWVFRSSHQPLILNQCATYLPTHIPLSVKMPKFGLKGVKQLHTRQIRRLALK